MSQTEKLDTIHHVVVGMEEVRESIHLSHPTWLFPAKSPVLLTLSQASKLRLSDGMTAGD